MRIAKSTSWAARMLTTFNGHGTSALKRQSPQVCYYPSGEISPYDIPCGTGEAVVCCPNEWTCEDNGLCSLPSKQYYGLFSCTDWSSSHCPTSCANDTAQSSTAGEAVLQCSPGSYCCDGLRRGPGCCDSTDARFSLGALRVVTGSGLGASSSSTLVSVPLSSSSAKPTQATIAPVVSSTPLDSSTQSTSTPYPTLSDQSHSLTAATLGPSATSLSQEARASGTAQSYGSITTCYTAKAQPSAPICYKDLSGSQAQILSLTILHGAQGSCIEPGHMLLWFVFYNVFAVVAGLVCGARSARQSVARHLGRAEDSERESALGPLAVRVGVSFTMLVLGTVATAFILTGSAESFNRGGPLFGLWAARPLATPLAIWLNMINPREYNGQAIEVAYADSLFGVLSVYAFVVVATATDPLRYAGASRSLALRIAQAGSALGILTLLVSVGLALAFARSCYRAGGFRHDHVLFWTLPVHAFRYLACWFLWSGALFANERAFCPQAGTVVGVMFVWLLVPLLDNVLRGWMAGRTDRPYRALHMQGETST